MPLCQEAVVEGWDITNYIRPESKPAKCCCSFHMWRRCLFHRLIIYPKLKILSFTCPHVVPSMYYLISSVEHKKTGFFFFLLFCPFSASHSVSLPAFFKNIFYVILRVRKREQIIHQNLILLVDLTEAKNMMLRKIWYDPLTLTSSI